VLDSGSCVNLGLSDDDLEVCSTTWSVAHIVLILPEHGLGLDLLGDGVGETLVEHHAILG